MKKAFLILAAVTMLLSIVPFGVATAGDAPVKIGGILQAGGTFNLEDEGRNDRFTTNRARFLFSGQVIPDKVKFFVQTETAGGVGLLDVKAMFSSYIPNTTICVGRFLPMFTLYMPYHTGKLELINYPWTTTTNAMWRQTGVQTTSKFEMVDVHLGVFNGADIRNNTTDNNDAKDFLGSVVFKPPVENAKIHIGGYGWLGNAKAVYETYGKTAQGDIEEDDTLKNNTYGGYAKADYKMDDMTLKFRGEFTLHQCEWLMDPGKVEDAQESDAQALFVQGSVQPAPKYEILARFETFDPDTDVDDDATSRFTVGANYYLDGLNCMFYLNYLHQMWEADGVDAVGTIQGQVQLLF